jgi:hypothetical protein
MRNSVEDIERNFPLPIGLTYLRFAWNCFWEVGGRPVPFFKSFVRIQELCRAIGRKGVYNSKENKHTQGFGVKRQQTYLVNSKGKVRKK